MIEDYEQFYSEPEDRSPEDYALRSNVWIAICGVIGAAIIFIALKLGWIA